MTVYFFDEWYAEDFAAAIQSRLDAFKAEGFKVRSLVFTCPKFAAAVLVLNEAGW